MLCSMHNLSAMLSSPTQTDLSITLMYSTRVRGNFRDMLLHLLVIGRVHR